MFHDSTKNPALAPMTKEFLSILREPLPREHPTDVRNGGGSSKRHPLNKALA